MGRKYGKVLVVLLCWRFSNLYFSEATSWNFSDMVSIENSCFLTLFFCETQLLIVRSINSAPLWRRILQLDCASCLKGFKNFEQRLSFLAETKIPQFLGMKRWLLPCKHLLHHELCDTSRKPFIRGSVFEKLKMPHNLWTNANIYIEREQE